MAEHIKDEPFIADEKEIENKEEYWLNDAKDVKLDEENTNNFKESYSEIDETDIAIINDVTVVEDDPELLCFTIRGLIIGIVSISDLF